MRKLSASIASLILSLSLMCGCAPKAVQPVDVTSKNTPAPAQPAETVPEVQLSGEGYTTMHRDLFLPEDAADEQAQYRLTCSYPLFENEALNGAIELFLDELYTRVTTERMPLADGSGDLPFTLVDFTLQYASLPSGRYTNIIFSETASYGEGTDQETCTHVIVAGPDGSECSLASASGAYFPEGTVAQQIWNIIATEPDKYYGDVTVEDILPVLDLYNGFTVADEGYTVYLPADTVAQDACEFSFARSALYPGFVGDVMTAEEYEAALPLLNAAAAACGPDFFGFEGAPPEQLAASAVREYLLNGKASVTVTPDEYKAASMALFGSSDAANPGVVPSSGSIQLTASEMPLYRMQPEDAYSEGDSITVTGCLMYGLPGSSDAASAASVSARLLRRGESFILYAFEIM